MSVHTFRGKPFYTGHEREAFGFFLQEMINRFGESDIDYYVISEIRTNDAKIDLLLITKGVVIIADLKELMAAKEDDAEFIQLEGKQNGPWKYILPNSEVYTLGGDGKNDNPFVQLDGFRYEFADWVIQEYPTLFGKALTRNQILDRLAAWCIPSPGYDGNEKKVSLEWDLIHNRRDWFKICSLKRLSWDFNCASNTLVKLSENQIMDLIGKLGATEITNLAEVLPVPPPPRDPFFSKPHICGEIVDRLNEREELEQFLEDEKISIFSLRGLGGVGKTELAAWLSNNATKKKFDVRWVDCSEKEVTVESFLAAIAGECTNVYDAQLILNKKLKLVDRMEAALNHIAKKHTLILFNDFHKIADNKNFESLLTHIVQHYDQIKVILTTRVYPVCFDNPRWRPGTAKDYQIEGLPEETISQFITLDTGHNLSPDLERDIQSNIWESLCS